jgi:hypothetical protein
MPDGSNPSESTGPALPMPYGRAALIAALPSPRDVKQMQAQQVLADEMFQRKFRKFCPIKCLDAAKVRR